MGVLVIFQTLIFCKLNSQKYYCTNRRKKFYHVGTPTFCMGMDGNRMKIYEFEEI